MSTASAHAAHSTASGAVSDFGKVRLQIIGRADAAMRQLHDHLERALALFPMDYQIKQVTEPRAAEACGADTLPALLLDGLMVSEGTVPTVEHLVELLHNRYLFHSKLYRLKKILVPVDMSDHSAQALQFAWQMAARLGATIEVFHVMDSIYDGHIPSSSGMLSNYKNTTRQELEEFAHKTLQKIGVQWPADGQHGPDPEGKPRLFTSVAFGFPDTSIVAASDRADLIVMGTGGNRIGARIFGSISTEVSKAAHCPVLFVPAGCSFHSFANILYASNFDSLDSLRIRQAIAFAGRFDSQVHFVHVGPAGEKVMEVERKIFETNYLATHAPKPFLFRKMIADGDVVEMLDEYALMHRIDLLVFVTRQRSFWEGLLHQSISRQALLTSQLPVLVIHADNDLF
jgi:nucleotide-binding universal stress UspA family protein